MRSVALLVIAHLLAILAMAASPALHQWIHNDAGHDDHECAVTDMLSGAAPDGVPCALVVVAPLPPQQFATVAEFDPQWLSFLFLSRCVFEHAPPSVS